MTISAVLIDTETTGLVEPVAVDIGMIELGKHWDEVLRRDLIGRYNPGKKIGFGAMATHHITDADVADRPLTSTFRLPPVTEYLVGHNVDYDWEAIGKPGIKRICTLALSRALWPETDSHNLGAMMYLLGDKEGIALAHHAHNANADVSMCWILLSRYISPRMPKIVDWDGMHRASERARIPRIISFGKHKGMAVADLPRDYVSWLLRQDDLDQYLRIALTGGPRP